MAKQVINIGASANDGSGDPLRNAFDKTNDNFNELYFAMGGNTPVSLFDGSGNLNLLGKPHKVSFYYAAEATILALSASAHKGCVAQAEDTGYMYYSDGSAWVKVAKFDELASAGGSANTFGTIAVSGQSSVIADSSTDTLTLVAGSNITLTTDANADSITIAASGGGAGAINDLSDVTISSPSNGQVLKYNGSAWVNAADATSGTGTFIGLTDTPSAFGSAGQVVRINSAGDGLEFANPTSGITTFIGLSDTPSSLGTAGQIVRMNSSGNALEFASISAGYADADVDTHLNTSTATSGQVLSWTGTDYDWVAQSGGGSLSRVTEAQTTASIADGSSANIAYSNLGKSYSLYTVQVDKACWVRIYSDTASRTADAGRTQGSDPAEGAGVIAEFIATGATTFKITPAIFGYIDNSETTIPVAVKNNSGSTGTVQVTITALKLEN